MPAPKMRSERTFTQSFQKNRRKSKRLPPPPPPPPQENSSDEETYENAEAVSSYARSAQRAANQRDIELSVR